MVTHDRDCRSSRRRDSSRSSRRSRLAMWSAAEFGVRSGQARSAGRVGQCIRPFSLRLRPQRKTQSCQASSKVREVEFIFAPVEGGDAARCGEGVRGDGEECRPMPSSRGQRKPIGRCRGTPADYVVRGHARAEYARTACYRSSRSAQRKASADRTNSRRRQNWRRVNFGRIGMSSGRKSIHQPSPPSEREWNVAQRSRGFGEFSPVSVV